MSHDRRATAVLGALVADAAALGLHWLYDVDRIAEVAENYVGFSDGVHFLPPDAENYEGTKGYFAHAKRERGQTSQYGECLSLAIRAMSSGRFDVCDYQTLFKDTFGPGGDWVGYVDRPTAGTLANLAADQTATSGIDDDQLPALTRLPVVVAYGTPDDVVPAIQITNVNDDATIYGQIFATLLRAVLDGATVADALQTAIASAPETHASTLRAARETAETDSVAYGKLTGRDCHLPHAMPLIFHILTHADSFADAADRNIRAGGDSCGRAIAIGAITGAAHGIDGAGIPLEWILETHDAAWAWFAVQEIGAIA